MTLKTLLNKTFRTKVRILNVKIVASYSGNKLVERTVVGFLMKDHARICRRYSKFSNLSIFLDYTKFQTTFPSLDRQGPSR